MKHKLIKYVILFLFLAIYVVATQYDYILPTNKNHDEFLAGWCKDHGYGTAITEECLIDYGQTTLSEDYEEQAIDDTNEILNWIDENPENWKAFKYNTKQLYKNLVKYRCTESAEEITDMGCLSVEASGKECVYDLDSATKKNWSCTNSVWTLI